MIGAGFILYSELHYANAFGHGTTGNTYDSDGCRLHHGDEEFKLEADMVGSTIIYAELGGSTGGVEGIEVAGVGGGSGVGEGNDV